MWRPHLFQGWATDFIPKIVDKAEKEKAFDETVPVGGYDAIRTAQELARGNLEQVLIKGAQGYVVMTSAGDEAVITVMAKSNAKLGLIFLDVKRAAERIGQVL